MTNSVTQSDAAGNVDTVGLTLAGLTDALRRVERLIRDIKDVKALWDAGPWADAKQVIEALETASSGMVNMFTGIIEREARSIVG